MKQLGLACAVTAALVRLGFAAPPTGYQCAPGTTKVGVGCTCPATHTSERDGEGIAICRARPLAAPIPSRPPPAPAPVIVAARPAPTVKSPTAKLTVIGTSRFQLPPIVPSEPKPIDSSYLDPAPTTPPRAEQEQILVKLVEDTPDSDAEEKASYYFKLAELYTLQYRYWSAKGDAAKAKDFLIKATKNYRALVDNTAFRNTPKLDAALFANATMLERAGYLPEARKSYQRLITDFPASVYIPPAYLAFADWFFAANDLVNADTYYQKVLKFPKHAVYPYALYKTAFVHHKLQRYQEALEVLFKVADLTKSDSKPALNRAAKLAYARVFAVIGKPDKTIAAFERVDRGFAITMATEAATATAELGNHEKAAIIYAALIEAEPAAQSGCSWQSALARERFLAGSGHEIVVDVCMSEIDAFKGWARSAGIDVK